jgi:hypothetical protein
VSDPVTEEEYAQAAATLATAAGDELLVSTACPGCGTRFALLVRCGLQASPVGSHSLSGSQMKASARLASLLRCVRCDWTGTGEPKGAER